MFAVVDKNTSNISKLWIVQNTSKALPVCRTRTNYVPNINPALVLNASAFVPAEDTCKIYQHNHLLVDTRRSWHNAGSELYPRYGRWANINLALVQGFHYWNDFHENDARCTAQCCMDVGQRRQRWCNIETALDLCIMYPWYIVVTRHIAKHDGCTAQHWNGLVWCWLAMDANINWKLWWTLNKSQITAQKHILRSFYKRYNHPCSGWREIEQGARSTTDEG